ncbi:hypothetical protein O181_055397 [Austropuccinia psidii MF-1]|uniref:CCHC-type domain-containing protein n=1 Tax=Austropuccinia psidii MF-1 TaxID=1389203 RepID=A0A9Q3HTF1_9BASI|nr:hypothetical protein [Austropuccinia psidii MF-1]
MTTGRGSQYSIQSDGGGLKIRVDPSKGKRKGNIPSGTESTQGSAISKRKVPDMPMISEPELELNSITQCTRTKIGKCATTPPRSDELLAYPEKISQRGGNSEILQWMESTVTKASNQEDKGEPCQKERGNQGRSFSSFYQQASSQPTSPRREKEQEKELEETIFPKLKDPKNPKRCHGQFLQHGKNLDGIQGQRGTKNETTSFPKEIPLSPYVVNTLTEIINSILPLKDIRNSLLTLQEINNSLSYLTKNKLITMNLCRCIEPCSTEEYINSLEDIVTRTKIGRAWRKVDIKSPNELFIKKDKQRETFKPKTPNNEQRKCHKCRSIGHLANNCLKKANINEIEETDDHNDKEEESDSEKDIEDSEASESDEINIINAQINNIDLLYEVSDVNSNLPQVGTSDKSLTNIQDSKLNRTIPAKVMEYTAGKSSISIVMVENQEEKVNLDTGAYCTCVGKRYLESIVPDWEGKIIPIQRVKFSSASEIMKPLGIIDLKLIFPHPSQFIRVKVELVVMDNFTSNHFVLGNDYLSICGIDISNQKDRYFTIGDNKRKTFGFSNNKK